VSNYILDVLMVWHSYMLHPRSLLADCMRLSKMGFWTSGLPWEAVESCIEEKTYRYYLGDKAIRHFEAKTGHSWDNLEGPPSKILTCLRCKGKLDAPWTTATSIGCDPDVAFAHCTGFADKSFRVQCPACKFSITHANLQVSYFRHDMKALLKDGTPMPGTLLSLRGTPAEKSNRDSSFPNRLITNGIKVELLQLTDPAGRGDNSIESIRNLLERSLKNRRLLRQVNETVLPTDLSSAEGISIRRMMSSYWDNASPFSLDLVGAVIRQGAFIEQMEQLNWIQSPSLLSILANLIEKYGVFWDIMVKNPDHVVVPTLDVDLAWHTHQLSPARYYAFSTNRIKNTLVNHDDKVDENKISDAFEWTSKQYEKLTGGKIYSECTCWYCEAVRESQFQSLSSLTSISSSLAARANASSLGTDVQGDTKPHISSHNSVRTLGQASPRASEIKADKLKKNWENARKRNQKTSRRLSREPASQEVEIPSQVRIWGVLCDAPQYGSYMRDPGVHGDIYPFDPLYMNVAPGAPGNCVAGIGRESVGRGGCVSAATRDEAPGKYRGGRPGFCQGLGGMDSGGGGMF